MNRNASPAWPWTPFWTAHRWPRLSGRNWPSRALSFARSTRRSKIIPIWSRSIWARSCRRMTIFLRRSIRPSSATARFATSPKGVRCPMELSTYFRINTAGAGQFERTLHHRRRGQFRSATWKAARRPMRDTNQLHAAVVELIALDNAEHQILHRAKLVSGRQGRQGRHLQFRDQARQVRRAQFEDFLDAGGNRLGHHLEISQRACCWATIPSANFIPWP